MLPPFWMAFLVLTATAPHINCFNITDKGVYAENGFDSNDTLIQYVSLSDEHPCKRTCTVDAPPMLCKYKFDVEWYQTMSKACYRCPEVVADCFRTDCIVGDGTVRSITVINRMLPGPTIEVCLNDEVEIEVENLLMGESTTIHWHGHHQKNTPYMDGVPFVTQCPIQPGNVFTYKFHAKNAGTHFWHSHTSLQRGDGAFGAFIVHTPEEIDPHWRLYDWDLSTHVINIFDWDSKIGLDMYLSHYHNGGTNKPAKLLVNGLGFDFEENRTPLARFEVERGYRYRFRLINEGFLNCPIEVSVDNHTLNVISSDGVDFKAVKVDSLVSYAGERFDFIISADQPVNLYWMRFRGLMDCDERFTRAHQVAVLQYKGTTNDSLPNGPLPTYETSYKEGLQLNPLNEGVESNTSISIPQLESLDDWDVTMQAEPDEKFFIGYDFYKIDNPFHHRTPHYGFNNVSLDKRVLTPQLNYITFKAPQQALLPERHNVNDALFCNETTLRDRNCKEEFCHCTHVIQVKLNSIVELVLIDTGFAYDANHPFHLHGHSFRVVGMERLGPNVTVEEVKSLDERGLLKRNLRTAPIKDTVTVPDGGYTIIRFNASNPGYWLFHCHIEFHVEVGMAMLFKFGDDADMPPIPDGFPRCGVFTDSAGTSRHSIIVLSLLIVILFIVNRTAY